VAGIRSKWNRWGGVGLLGAVAKQAAESGCGARKDGGGARWRGCSARVHGESTERGQIGLDRVAHVPSRTFEIRHAAEGRGA